MPAASKAAQDLAAEVAFLPQVLKAPTLRESVPRLAELACAESSRKRSSSSPACTARSPTASLKAGEGRIGAARLPARKSVDEFDFDYARGLDATRGASRALVSPCAGGPAPAGAYRPGDNRW
jgi:hypothetical protein